MIQQKLALIPLIMNAISVNGNTLYFGLNGNTAQKIYQTYTNPNTQQESYYMKTTNNTDRNNYLDIHTNNYSAQQRYNIDQNEYVYFENLYITAITPYNNIRNTEIN